MCKHRGDISPFLIYYQHPELGGGFCVLGLPPPPRVNPVLSHATYSPIIIIVHTTNIIYIYNTNTYAHRHLYSYIYIIKILLLQVSLKS